MKLILGVASLALSATIIYAEELQSTWAPTEPAPLVSEANPTIRFSGLPQWGEQVTVKLSGAPSNSPGLLFLAPPRGAAGLGLLIVPATMNPIPFRADEQGEFTHSFIWPLKPPGSILSTQALFQSASGALAVSASAMSVTVNDTEAVAFAHANALAVGWQGIDPVSASEVMVIKDAADVLGAVEIIVSLGTFPNTDSDGINPEIFSAGVIPTYVSNGQISAGSLSQYRNDLISRISPGDRLVEVVFNEAGFGQFTTYSTVRPATGHVRLNNFAEHFCSRWPEPLDTLLGDNSLSPGTAHHDTVNYSAKYLLLGYNAFEASASILLECSSGSVTICNATSSSSSNGMWECEIGVDPQTSSDGDCCVVTVECGAASGFKSATLSSNGTKVSISGTLGQSMSRRDVLIKCCYE